MVCVHCGHGTRVSNSRPQRRGNRVWRRRQCKDCGATFTTLETTDYGAAWLVKAAEGQLEPFSRDKLFLTLYDACRHRPDAVREAADLTDTVIRTVSPLARDGAIAAADITAAAQTVLKRFDMAAGVHFAVFHLGTDLRS